MTSSHYTHSAAHFGWSAFGEMTISSPRNPQNHRHEDPKTLSPPQQVARNPREFAFDPHRLACSSHRLSATEVSDGFGEGCCGLGFRGFRPRGLEACSGARWASQGVFFLNNIFLVV